MFSIIISEKGGAERRETYDRTEINVGRVQGNDLMLPKGNVSKRHARLLFRDGRFIVTDLKSTNGTYVNGRKIAQATIVREGDKIYIGDFVLRIESADGAVAGSSAGASDPGALGAAQGMPTGGPPPPANEDSSDAPAPDPGMLRPAALAKPASAPRGAGPSQPSPGPSATPRPTSPPPVPIATPPVLPLAPVPPAGLMGGPPPLPAMQGSAPQAPPMIQPPAMVHPPSPHQAPVFGAVASPITTPPSPPAFGPQGPSQPPAARPEPFGGASAPAFAAPQVINQLPTVPPAAATVPPRAVSNAPGVSSQPAPSGLAGMPSGIAPGSGPVPSPLPSSKRVDQPPVDPSQAAEHRAALAKLVERTLAAVDLSSLANGEAPDGARIATIDRALREKAASMRGTNEIPAGLDPEVLVAEAKREFLELGPIGPLLEDEDVEEVQVIRHDHVVALHGRRQISTEIAFTSEQAVARVVRRICARAGLPLQADEQFVERRLERGGRMFGVLPPTSGEGHMLVFRKPQRALLTLDDLVRSGTVSRAMASLFAQCVAGRANILVTGAVNSGASALLGALAGAGGIDDRVIVLQEDDELIFNQPHTVSILIGDTADDGARAVRAAIRVRPDRLVVGSFAGHVVAEVVDAVGDGVDGVLAAARAPTLRHLIQRVPADLAATRGLTSVDTAREWIAAAFDLVIEVARLRDGRQRVMRVAEFGFKDGHRELIANDIFTFTVERTAAGGTVEGSFHATGHIPRVVEELVARGGNLDMGIFKR